jgi:hypothetical protein
MTPESQNTDVREVSWRCPLLCIDLLEPISTKMNMHNNGSPRSYIKRARQELWSTETLERIPITEGHNQTMRI